MLQVKFTFDKGKKKKDFNILLEKCIKFIKEKK